MITVRLPSMLRQPEMVDLIHIEAPVSTLDELVVELDRRYPGLASALDDSMHNFAINDAIVLHGVGQHPLRDGDVVEVVPTLAGG